MSTAWELGNHESFSHFTSSLKHKLVLPSTSNDWKMLDDYLKVQVLPSVFCATDPESKYTVLVDGIYNSIAQCFGNMISHHNDFKNSKERRIEIRLLNVRMLKKECRRQSFTQSVGILGFSFEP